MKKRLTKKKLGEKNFDEKKFLMKKKLDQKKVLAKKYFDKKKISTKKHFHKKELTKKIKTGKNLLCPRLLGSPGGPEGSQGLQKTVYSIFTPKVVWHHQQCKKMYFP